MSSFTHVDGAGKATMVDVSAKSATLRVAQARAIINLPQEVMSLLQNGEIAAPKGAVFQTAIIAGILAAKKTGDLIPLCHPLGLDDCNINISINNQNKVVILCTARITARTGIEMEAMVGASIAALTIYDMCKGVSPNIVIEETRLISKTGGKKDFIHHE